MAQNSAALKKAARLRMVYSASLTASMLFFVAALVLGYYGQEDIMGIQFTLGILFLMSAVFTKRRMQTLGIWHAPRNKKAKKAQ